MTFEASSNGSSRIGVVGGDDSSVMSTALSKKKQQQQQQQRGRFKKLRKRLLEVKQGRDVSGLTAFQDHQELRDLLVVESSFQERQKPPSLHVGPSVRLRRAGKDEQQQQQQTEGVDHGHVLWRFVVEYLQQQRQQPPSSSSSCKKKNKKRSRSAQQNLPKIPSWATLHNPGTLESVAIIEVDMEGAACDETLLAPLTVLQSLQEQHGHPTKIALTTKTRWFQGPRPKSITDMLMYLPRPQEEEKSEAQRIVDRDDESPTTFPDVIQRLQSLQLPEQIRRAEGYPMVVLAADKTGVDDEKWLQPPPTLAQHHSPLCGIPLKKVRDIVELHKVSISGEDEAGTGSVFVATRAAVSDSDWPRVFAVDCEMVRTAAGSELARVTLLRWTGFADDDAEQQISYEVVMDECVRPHRPVLDYLTEYSGMSAERLASVTTRLEQVQAAFLSCLHKNDILVGHSLENDLHALHLVHDHVIDTSMVFRAAGGRKYSLRHLSATLLGKKIQGNGNDGHCSEEDAVSALHLAVRRAIKGPSFCIRESVDNRLHLLQSVKEGPVVCVGPSDWLKKHVTSFCNSAHALSCESVTDTNRKAVAAWLSSSKRRAKLVWAKLVVPAKDQTERLKDLNNVLTDLVERMLPGTIVLFAIQCGYERSAQLASKQKILMDPRSSLTWSSSDEVDFQRALNTSRDGMVYWIGDRCCCFKQADNTTE